MTDKPNLERVTHTRRLESDSHHKVYQVFESLITNPGRGRLESHGKTYYKPGDETGFENSPDLFKVSEHHKRKTSFTEEQEKYIDLCRVDLRDSITSEESGLLAKFKKKWESGGEQNTFEDILCDSYLECINDAFDKNPNLAPAYFGFLVSSGAGSDGLQLALHEGLYPRSIFGSNLPENYKSFVGIHGSNINRGENGEVESEVQCAAPALAMKIIGEVQKCTYYAGLKVDDVDNTRFGGPSTDIASSIRSILEVKMKTLGYKVSKSN